MRVLITIMLMSVLSATTFAEEPIPVDPDSAQPNIDGKEPSPNDGKEPTPQATSDVVQGVIDESHVSASDLLSFGLRMDSIFTAGSPYQQGFSIPSLRFTAFGEIGDYIDYRMSLGETREFSTVLLPQIMPVEAYIDVKLGGGGGGPKLNMRTGMFTPSATPLWGPDLSLLNLPDYNEVDRALLLNRDIGAEVSYSTGPSGILFGAGVFNGTGIVSLNTNNAKAINIYMSKTFEFGETKLVVGGASTFSGQSSRGSINFKTSWIASAYADFSFAADRLRLYAEGMWGNYEDTSRAITTTGGSASAWFKLASWSQLFGRYEQINARPTDGAPIRHFQVGPVLNAGENLKAFILYDYLSLASDSSESSLLIRLRLLI